MCIHSIVEVSIEFDCFRNIDLFHQGLYHLKARIYRDIGELRTFAVPFGSFTCPYQEQAKGKASRPDHHNLIPGYVVEDDFAYATRSFLIRYCEEEVEINDVGQFRLDLNPSEAAVDTPWILEVELMFADLSQHGGADRFGEQPNMDVAEFKSVSKHQLRIHGVGQGTHTCCPIVFDEYHFCMLNMAVHSALLDYRWRSQSSSVFTTRPRPPTTGQTPASGGAQQEALVGGTQALSLGESLFAECPRGDRERLLKTFESAYRHYLGALVASYAELNAWLRRLCGTCVAPAQLEALGGIAEIAELELPDGLHKGLLATNGHASAASKETLRSLLEGKLRQLGGDAFTAAQLERSAAQCFAYDINVVSCQVMDLWYRLQHVMSLCSREVRALLRGEWERRTVDQMQVPVVREESKTELTSQVGRSVWDSHCTLAEKLRAEAKTFPLGTPAVEDPEMRPDTESSPILFDERCGGGSSGSDFEAIRPPLPSAPKLYRGVHLFVLVHGFQGNSFDMRLMKNNIALLYPEAVFLCSTANEDNTDGDFSEMGIRLAQEVVNYICDWCPGSALGRLSFVAHSIGGLITRAALPLLHEYKSKMFTFLTFSSAHVGYFLKNISLFHVGLRALQTWRQSECLSQLTMADKQDPRETFMYKLSKAKGFEYFQHVVLVSCPSDQYGPFDSARVEIGGMLSSASDRGTYTEMVHNIWESVDPKRVYRFDVNFKIAEKNLDTFIGRAAHIQFLECQAIMRMIIHGYSFMFR